MGVVKTPGRPANLDGVEDKLPGGIRYKETRRSRLGGGEKPFGGSAVFGTSSEKTTNEQLRRQGNPTTAGPAPLTNQMMESLDGYLDNIAAVATKTAAKGGPLTELEASLAISVDTIARQQQSINRFP